MTLWTNARLPRFASAVLDALRFDSVPSESLRELTPAEWRKATAFCDRSQLTLFLGRAAGDALPEDVRESIRRKREANVQRFARIRESYFEIAAALETAAIEFAVLKGFTQYPRFTPDLHSRVQYDLDLICLSGDVLRACNVLASLAYEPMGAADEFPTDHVPTMIRKTGWEWRGDFFDPEIPLSVDLHFRFWDEETERICAPGVERFWDRRAQTELDGRCIPCLDPVDAAGYSALHLLRHLLRGSLKIGHVYELASFLHSHAADDGLWRQWRALHPEPLRRLQAVSFELAAVWFGCVLPPAVVEEIARLPDAARLWLAHHAAAPVEAMFRPNKTELWLHLSLLESRSDKWRVLRRRLLPARLPGPIDAVYVPDSMRTWRVQVRSTARYVAFLAERARYHLRALVSLASDGAAFWLRANGLERGYWSFLASASLFNLGMFVFVVLYNLYLLGRGSSERELGWISSAMTAGSIAGTLPAGLVTQRLGLRATLALACGITAMACALRSTVIGLAPLIALAFVHGAAFAGWAVSIPPTIASLSPENRRAAAFSIFFASSVALGVAGGWLAGHLPGWLGVVMAHADSIELKQVALLVGCALAALAVWPALQLKAAMAPAGPASRAVYPRGRFIARYLAVFGVWNLATGSFNPFFNAYFSTRLHASTETIGEIFSAAQIGQVLSLAAAPYVFRRVGIVSGVAGMMLATGAALLCLAGAASASIGAAGYAAYMAFQWMSEPGMSTLIMSRVKPEERGGASSLNYLVAFTAQAIAAAVAGWFLSRAGYSPVLLAAAGLAVTAALAFRKLLFNAQNTKSSSGSLQESAAESVTR